MTSSRTRPAFNSRNGLTLVEIMIALTMTLIVLGAMMTAFQFASQQMQMGRGVMEMANRLRVAEELLRSDLRNLTVDPRTYTESTNPNGYFEIVEGPQRDLNYPLTANGAMTGIRDGDSDGIPNPIDFDSTGGTDNNGNGVDDRFDSAFPGNSYKGDYDDAWSGTIRSQETPFRGRYIAPSLTVFVPGTSAPTVDFGTYTTNIIESPLAEIIWWSSHDDTDGDYALDFAAESVNVYRRVLLIRPGLVLPAFADLAASMRFLATNDISARVETRVSGGTTYYQVVANEITDLAVRKNRFSHHPVSGAAATFPQALNRSTLLWLRSADYDATGATVIYNGNDIILTNVAAFDLKVYSPTAAVGILGGVTVEPDDIGFPSVVAADKAAIGAFVDLGHNGGSWFSGFATPKSQLTYQYRGELGTIPVEWLGLMDTVYDTWTPYYESDGEDQDGLYGVDQGTDGAANLDGGGAHVGTAAPDDDAERETRPPYPYPVRGVKATIRLVEDTTKQIHQSSVVHSYVPE